MNEEKNDNPRISQSYFMVIKCVNAEKQAIDIKVFFCLNL